MAIVVGTNSYITEAELTTYATDRGITIAGTLSVLLIKALDYLETRQYIGSKTVYNQALQFPRVLCGDYSQYPQSYALCPYDSLTVPNEVKTAQCIAAILIYGGNDLQAVQGQSVKRERVDVIEVEYQDNTSATKQFTALNDILRPFIKSGMRGTRI